MKHVLYKPDKNWYVGELFKLALVAAVTAYCFYASIYGLLMAIPLVIYLFIQDYKACMERNKKHFINDFREMMQVVDSNICAGRSLENSFVEAKLECCKRKDMGIAIRQEMSELVRGLQLNKGMEELLIGLGESSGVDEIKNFAGLVNIAKIHGGDLCGLIRQFISNISRRKIIEEELETMMSAKKTESLIMVVMPYAIVVYMRLTGSEYMQSMYTTLIGRAVMTVALIIVYITVIVMRKIVVSNQGN